MTAAIPRNAAPFLTGFDDNFLLWICDLVSIILVALKPYCDVELRYSIVDGFPSSMKTFVLCALKRRPNKLEPAQFRKGLLSVCKQLCSLLLKLVNRPRTKSFWQPLPSLTQIKHSKNDAITPQ
ncbi:hypothetical protein [Halomonas sp. DN3]|uniref:hypothetical protein n=1 Tax=Halomonas sp. DN3 TaxID=2953657 RepID=UPI00209FC614|nr:hypothetical protein [Halomonas sp. DN3]USZ51767.1 hypothetical protein NKF27_09850 [Halomonas sp. DN3]